MEELHRSQLDLQNENKKLWAELKEKNSRIVGLNDQILLQKDTLKRQAELKAQLFDYLETIKSMQKTVTYLQQENKFLEEKLMNTQLSVAEISRGDNYPVQLEKLTNENLTLKMKVHSLEKEVRRYIHLWDKNLTATSDIIAARETIINLERKLMEYQSAATELKRMKQELVESEEGVRSTTAANGALKEELDRVRVDFQRIAEEKEDLKKRVIKYTEMIIKLKDENTSMERFVEKSFRLEGALAELDDLNVVLKKQETVLGMLFDENQSLKEGISRLFDEMNGLKDRNWKLERYANEMEDSYYTAEKNVNALEKKLDDYQALETEMEKLKAANAEIGDRSRRLEDVNNSLIVKLETSEKKLSSATCTLNMLKNDNQNFMKENSALKADITERSKKLIRENELLKTELEKQKSLVLNYTAILTQFKDTQKRLDETQQLLYKVKEELRMYSDENAHLKSEIQEIAHRKSILQADCERYLEEIRNARITARGPPSWIKQMQYH